MSERPTQSPNEDTAWYSPAGMIRKGMPVIAPDGTRVGIVARVEKGEIVLDGLDEHGQETFVSITQVDGVSDEGVLLEARGDETFGLGAQP